MAKQFHDLNAERLPLYVHPLVEMIHEEKPEHIIACERGARLVGLAVFLLHRELYGVLPTLNKSIDFVRIPSPKNSQKLEPYMSSLEERGVKRIMFIDDLYASGSTCAMAREVFSRFTTRFAVVGNCRVVSDVPDFCATGFETIADPEWDNDPSIIGVDYDYDEMLKPNRYKTSLRYRREISKSVKEYIRKQIM